MARRATLSPSSLVPALTFFIFFTVPALALTPPPQSYVLESHGYAVAPNSPFLTLNSAFTLECWVYEDSQVHVGTLLGRESYDKSDNEYALLLNDGQVFFGTHPGTQSATPGAEFPQNQWTHVAGVYTPGTIRLYLNGVEVGAQTGIPAPSAAPQSQFEVVSLRLGQGGLAMRQARVWNRALTASEIAAVAHTILTGREPGLAADWPLDDGSGQVARDTGPAKIPLQLGSSPNPDPADPFWVRAVILDTGPYYVLDTSHLNGVSTSCAPLCQMQTKVVIDFNHDGRPDLIAFTSSGTIDPSPIVALRNDGGGNFSDVTTSVFPAGAPSTQSAWEQTSFVADFNRDGLPDVYVGDGGPDINGQRGAQSKLLLTTTDGRFVDATANLPQIKTWTENGCGADLLHNGVLDILTDIGSGVPGQGLLLDINDGTGHFSADWSRLPQIENVISIQPIDVNNDGFPDIVLGISQFGPDRLFMNDGTGHFHEAPAGALPPREFTAEGAGTQTVRVGDFDGDGWQDIVEAQVDAGYLAGTGGSTRLVLLLNNRDGSFRDASELLPALDEGAPLGVEYPIDLNGDGKTDLFVFNGLNARPRLLYNTGRGFVDGSAIFPVGAPQGNVFPLDVFGTGRLDLFILTSNGYAIARNVKSLDPSILDPRFELSIGQVLTSPPAPVGGRH